MPLMYRTRLLLPPPGLWRWVRFQCGSFPLVEQGRTAIGGAQLGKGVMVQVAGAEAEIRSFSHY